ncbi:UPF0187-domain-containing protein [Mytilinidion resinicola]|uniref:UPF0187-domain-containing protein n=1 Tax=Mytilinidion resinicola TaxID=574789 RepID=A0A6A6Z5H2_9PEZI|nr:UPF0187-domain-containing protein [Mytilinidion resinicola]KAF2815913.1 UPF0187-domain-containing protein [Mytilinidion resinicola]
MATKATVDDRSKDLDDYFVGPRDMSHHSRWPMWLRMHGSVLSEMALPLLFVGGWATLITCLCKFVHNLGINSVLLTVLGFVVGLGLSFRSSSAYERYMEGRRYWATLILTSQNLVRLIWIHADERDGDVGKEDLLGKITACNLIVAFAVALKHKLRFEPYAHYDDLKSLIGHLDTFAQAAGACHTSNQKKQNLLKTTGEFLGELKRAAVPLGNLPLEILSNLSAYIKELFTNGTFKVSIYQTQALNNLSTLNDVLTGTDRVLNTPLPIAYSIAISQITWVYVCMLPFQLYKTLEWVTIPATIVAAYIILGIALIGNEIENPFGNDVNDLPLDTFCEELRQDVAVITSKAPPKPRDYVKSALNLPLFPLSQGGFEQWSDKGVEGIREGLRARARLGNASKEKNGAKEASGREVEV